MLRFFIILLLGLALFSTPALAAKKTVKSFTQKDFASLILKQFHWDAGLPKEPTDRDYLVVLGGKRNFRYEAENAYNAETDNVSVSEYEIYGSFSGKGWVMGVGTSTVTHFTIMNPIAGEYRIKSVLKGDGFVWDINGKRLNSGTKDKKMTEVEVGTLYLPAGVVQMTVTMPPNSGIDSFKLIGADYLPIGPFGGWRFKDKLTAGTLAEIMLSATGKLDTLPFEAGTNPIIIPVTSLSQFPEFTSFVDISYLGKFSSKQWLRSTYRGASLAFPFNVDKLGLYDVSIQIVSDKIVGDLNGTTFSMVGKPYFDKVLLGQFRLDKGTSSLNLTVSPMGGFDALHLMRRDTTPAAFMKQAGLNGNPDRFISLDEAEKLVKTFAPHALIRK